MRFLLAALFAMGLGSASFANAASVRALDKASFNEFVSSNDIALVEFFAPWCGHCKKLAPEYETAAQQLEASNIKLASVDCTVEKDLCSEYDVSGFPTLKIFRGSATGPAEYNGGRTSSEIVKYMKKQTEPAYVVYSDAAALQAAVSAERDGVFLLGVFSSVDSDEAKAFIATANTYRNEHSFGLVTDAALAATYSAAAATNNVLLLKAGEAAGSTEAVVSTGPFDEASLSTFIKAESFPLVGEIGPENFQKYVERGFPLLWIFVDQASPLTEPALAVARQVAATVKTSLSLVYLDGVKWAEHAKHFGLKGGELPGLVLEDRDAGKNYLFPFSSALTKDSLQAFVDGYAAKTLQPNVKSQEPPADNNGPVTTIVGKTFDAIALDEAKDVLVEFYAPWCGHCKSLAPKYEKLGEMFADNDNVVIAQVDATENDTPAKIKGFPTLILYKAGDKANPVTYEGERTEQALAAWLRANGNTFKTGAEPAAAAAEDHSGHSHDDL